MANFDDQVMGLTGLTISGSSTAPSQSELSTFLNDRVVDVTNKVIMLRPQDIENFLSRGQVFDMDMESTLTPKWQEIKDKHGNPLFDQETIDKWE